MNLVHRIGTLGALPRRLFLAAGLGAAWAVAVDAHAAPAVNTLRPGLLGGRDNVAIQGYDTVAYFTQGKAVPGDERFATQWRGARWHFASEAHLDAFKAAPEKYAPQYGGYCAYGVSRGYLVKVEPDQFRIIDGKLYLNFDAKTQAEWLKDPAGYIKAADAKFEVLLKQ